MVELTKSFAVTEGGTYRLRYEIKQEGAPTVRDGSRAWVASFGFLDDAGTDLAGPFQGFAHGKEYANFLYLRLRTDSPHREVSELQFIVPKDAATAMVAIVPWAQVGFTISNLTLVHIEDPEKVRNAVDALKAGCIEEVRQALSCLAKIPASQVGEWEIQAVEISLLQFTLRSALTAPELLVEALSLHWACLSLLDRVAAQAFDSLYRRPGNSTENTSALICSLVRQLKTQYGALPSFELYVGSALMVRGNRIEAFERFASAARLSEKFFGLGRMYVGAYSVTDKDWIDAKVTDLLKAEKEIHWDIPPKGVHEAYLLFSGDSVYMRNFSPFLIANLVEIGSALPVHFHVINPAKETVALLRDLRQASVAPISVSSETWPIAGDRTYFATARFYRLPEFFKLMNAPLFIADLDIEFVSAPEVALKAFSGVDVALRRSEILGRFPWWIPSGNFSYYSSTQFGRGFAEALRRYIAVRFNQQYPRSWWFDQLALNEVMFWWEETGHKVYDIDKLGRFIKIRQPTEVAHLKKGGGRSE